MDREKGKSKLAESTQNVAALSP
uniref:Uncharacterized protein n=1 Tax=Arundo donax TaxID=35708 RepID=A0A0A9BYB7_ARUDO